MIRQGYSRSQYDNCVYFKQFSYRAFVYLVLYVYDILIAFQDKLLIDDLKAQLSDEFEMKVLGGTKNILVMEIHRDRKARKLFLSQKKYIEKVLD